MRHINIYCELTRNVIETDIRMFFLDFNEPRETIVSARVRWNTRNWMLVLELVCICCPAFLWAVISTSRFRLLPTRRQYVRKLDFKFKIDLTL